MPWGTDTVSGRVKAGLMHRRLWMHETFLRKVGLASAAALALAIGPVSMSAPADAQHFGGRGYGGHGYGGHGYYGGHRYYMGRGYYGWRWGRLDDGLVLGAVAAPFSYNYPYGYPYPHVYGYGYPGYYGPGYW